MKRPKVLVGDMLAQDLKVAREIRKEMAKKVNEAPRSSQIDRDVPSS